MLLFTLDNSCEDLPIISLCAILNHKIISRITPVRSSFHIIECTLDVLELRKLQSAGFYWYLYIFDTQDSFLIGTDEINCGTEWTKFDMLTRFYFFFRLDKRQDICLVDNTSCLGKSSFVMLDLCVEPH